MIAYSALSPVAAVDACGPAGLADFAALAALHSDGWGTARLDPDGSSVRTAGGTDRLTDVGDLIRRTSEPATVRMLYLRFASRGAAPSPDNTQPFLRGDTAFQHNGLIAPRTELVGLLSPHSRTELRGDTDSEAYFAAIRDERRNRPNERMLDGIARGVTAVRERFADACLNAMLCRPDGLFVVHSPGTAPAPLRAFRERAGTTAALPPEHDENYNVLRTTTRPNGTCVVATSGIDQRGWTTLPVDSVTHFSSNGIRTQGL